MRINAVAVVGSFVLSTLVFAAGNAVAAVPEPFEGAVAVRQCIDPNKPQASVAEVQCLLNAAVSPTTFPVIPVDGVFGPATEAKVRVFQRCANSHGAGLVVDGRVDSKTLAALKFWANSGSYVC